MKVFNRTDLEQNRNDLREFVQIPRKSLIVCIEYILIDYTHKEYDILHMWNVLVWYQNACDNAYLIHVYHLVCFVGHKIRIKENG